MQNSIGEENELCARYKQNNLTEKRPNSAQYICNKQKKREEKVD